MTFKWGSSVPAYSLDLEGPDGNTYVPSHEFPSAMRAGDIFEYDGWTWQVLAVATKQFDAPGEPPETLRCYPKVSERFACRVTGQNRSTQRRPPAATTPADPDAGLRAWLRAWAKDHPRRGFRPAYHDARAEGWNVNHKKIQRLWRDEGLRVPQRRRRKRLGASTTPNPPTADAPNVVWAVDFQFDATTDGRPIKIVSIVDEHTRECLGGLVERNITGRHLIDELDRLAVDRGYPAVLRCDNGPELACAAMADWAGERVGLHFIPGQPWRNGYIESFNSRVRDECLSINMFWSLAQARVVISDWKEDYNHRRRHSALGYQAPAVYAAARTHP